MEIEQDLELGTKLISIAVSPKMKQRKKAIGLTWRRIIEIGIQTVEETKETEITKLLKLNKVLELNLQEANKRIDEYQTLLTSRTIKISS